MPISDQLGGSVVASAHDPEQHVQDLGLCRHGASVMPGQLGEVGTSGTGGLRSGAVVENTLSPIPSVDVHERSRLCGCSIHKRHHTGGRGTATG
jgi:hypothetical protein